MYLVTGGAGFIGQALVRALRAKGEAVRIFDLRAPRYLEEQDYAPGQLEFFRGDVTFRPEIEEALEGVRGVFHLAAQLLLAGGGPELQRVNVEGTRTVLEAVRRAGIPKVVYTSTGMLYAPGQGRPILEDDPPRPSGPYGRSKVETEGVCREYLEKGIDLAILRPLFVLGAGRLGLLHLLFDRVERGRPIYLVGDGSNRFHMIGVDDLAEACVLAAAPGKTGIFNVGVENPTSVRGLMEALRDHAGTGSAIRPLPKPLVAFGTHLLGRLGLSPLEDEHQRVASEDRVLDVSRARDVLGWRARRDDRQCMIDAYDWYLRAKTMPRDYRSDWPDGGLLRFRWLDRLI